MRWLDDMPRLKHHPIIRYKVEWAVKTILSGKGRLLKLEDGHAEVLEDYNAGGVQMTSAAVGWLSAKQVEKVEEILSSNGLHERPGATTQKDTYAK